MFGQNFGGENYVAYLQYHNFEVKYLDINKNTEREKTNYQLMGEMPC